MLDAMLLVMLHATVFVALDTVLEADRYLTRESSGLSAPEDLFRTQSRLQNSDNSEYHNHGSFMWLETR